MKRWWLCCKSYWTTARIRRMGKALFSQVCVCPQRGYPRPRFFPVSLGPGSFVRRGVTSFPGYFPGLWSQVFSWHTPVPAGRVIPVPARDVPQSKQGYPREDRGTLHWDWGTPWLGLGYPLPPVPPGGCTLERIGVPSTGTGVPPPLGLNWVSPPPAGTGVPPSWNWRVCHWRYSYCSHTGGLSCFLSVDLHLRIWHWVLMHLTELFT